MRSIDLTACGNRLNAVCLSCRNLDLSDTIARRDGVGWCMAIHQYRSAYCPRTCAEFSGRYTAANGYTKGQT